jgi:hypothetical protein
MMKGLLQSEPGVGNSSSMRFNLILASVGAFILMLSTASYIVISAIKANEPSWTEMGIFALGIAGILTGVGWTKTRQKETELKYNNGKKE